jgi:hypothetical protein
MHSNQKFPYGNLLILWGESYGDTSNENPSARNSPKRGYAKFKRLAREQTVSDWAHDVLSSAARPHRREQTILPKVLAFLTALLRGWRSELKAR